MRILVSLALVAVLPFAAACRTPYEEGVARMNAAIDTRLANAVGGTVGDFVARTGARPVDVYDRGPNRIFVFEGQLCAVRLEAERIAAGDAPDRWRVVGVDHAGRCEAIVARG